MTSHMDLIPITKMKELLISLTRWFVMGLRCKKSLCSGDRCIVQPLSSRNGDDVKKALLGHFTDATGEMETAERSTGTVDEFQST